MKTIYKTTCARFMTLLVLALLSVSNVWGEEKTLTFDLSSNNLNLPTAKTKSVAGNYTYKLDDVNYTFSVTDAQGTSDGGIYFSTSCVLVYASNAIGLPAIENYKLTKVVAKNSGNCSTTTKVGVSSSSSSASYISGGAIQTWSTTSSSYTYNLSGTSNNTMYYLYVTNKNAQIIELVLTYEGGDTPVEPVAPSITTQPKGASYEKDATATALTIVASGNPTPTYQWYSNTTESTSGASLISGATNASYTPSTATIGTKYYYCVATNTEGSATSDIVAVTVTAALPKITITQTSSGITTSYGSSTFTQNEVTFAYTEWMSSTDFIQAKASTSPSLQNTTAMPGKITKIQVVTGSGKTARAVTIKAGTTSTIGDMVTITAPTTSMDMVFDFGATNYSYFCLSTPGNACYFDKIVIIYEPDNSPVISADNVNLAADATSGEIPYSISNPVEGKNLTAETTAEWISNVDVDAANSKVTFNTTANEGAKRSAQITLSYEGARNDKVITVTQAKPTTFATLEALVATGAPQTDGETITVTLVENTITAVNTSYIDVLSGTQSVRIYKSGVPETWKVGGTVSGTLENCTWQDYKGTWELCPDDWTELSYTAPTIYAINIDKDIANGTVSANPTESAAGLEVSLTVTPATNYLLKNLTVTDASLNPVEVKDNKFTMPASAVTVSATFRAKENYTITWMANSEVFTTTQVVEGDNLVLATAPESIGDYMFKGWTAQENYYDAENAPEYITAETVPTANATYYAVFAKKIEVDGPKAYILSPTDFGTGSYSTNDGDKEINEITLTIKDVYQNSSSIQMKASSGSLYNKDALGLKITSVVVDVKTNSVKVYEGSANDSWTEVNVNEGTYTFNEDKAYFKVTSTGSYAQVKSITVNYIDKITSYSNYTTITPTDIVISEAGWATACLPFNATITSDNATAYYVTGTSGTALTKVEAEVIPAGEGVLLKSDNGAAATVTFTASTKTADYATGNMMKGSLEGETFSGGATYYILSTGGNGVGFYWDASTNDKGATANCAAGKAVLAVPTTAGIKSFFSLDDETTSIHNSQFIIHNSENVMYNLNGQVVGKDYKGIVIVNGKKMFNK